MASENLLATYNALANGLAELVQNEEALAVKLTSNPDVSQDELTALDEIIKATKVLQAQAQNLVTHYAEPSGEVPLIHGIEPAEGTILGGTPVIIDGHNFIGVTKLWFGDVPCIDFSVVDDETIDATSPKGKADGDVTVTAINSAGPSDPTNPEAAGTFTYSDPTLDPLVGEKVGVG